MIKFPKINLSIQLLLIFAFVMFYGHLIPLNMKSALLSLSQSLQDALSWVLPFIVGGCIFTCIIGQKSRALSFIAALFLMVIVSNAISSTIAFGLAKLSISHLGVTALPTTKSAAQILQPMWVWNIKPLFQNQNALIFGMVAGLLSLFFRLEAADRLGRMISQVTSLFLDKVLVPLIPLFAAGFIIRMQHEGSLKTLMANYLPIIILVSLTSLIYIVLMFGLSCHFKGRAWLKAMQNSVQASLAAFSSMSSLAAMPLTLRAADANTLDPEINKAVIPATVNIHMVGDSIAIIILTFAIVASQGTPLPTWGQYWLFLPSFLLARFGVAAIPGGSIKVILPLLIAHLGLQPEMEALTWALYMLFEPIVSATNVAGNSAFVMLVSQLFKKPELEPSSNI